MIKQGDSYPLKIKVQNDGMPLNIESVDTVEIFIGDIIKTYPDTVTYNKDTYEFSFPLTQNETHIFKPGKTVTFDLRVKFKSGDVTGITPQRIDVVKAMSKAVL